MQISQEASTAARLWPTIQQVVSSGHKPIAISRCQSFASTLIAYARKREASPIQGESAPFAIGVNGRYQPSSCSGLELIDK